MKRKKRRNTRKNRYTLVLGVNSLYISALLEIKVLPRTIKGSLPCTYRRTLFLVAGRTQREFYLRPKKKRLHLEPSVKGSFQNPL